MSKLYVGNLPTVVTEADLHLLFFESGIATSAVLLKKGGYAFVDCYEQSLADRAIDKLNGAVFLGVQIIVEPSVAAAQKKKSATKIEMGGGEPTSNLTNGLINSGGGCKVLVTNIPPHLNHSDVENLLGGYSYQTYEKGNSRDQTQCIIVTFDSSDSAYHAASELNNQELDGYHIKAEVKSGGPGGEEKRRGRPRGAVFPMGGGGGAPGARQTDFPLRILVQSDMVGAIIGRQGSTIRQITQQSRARVDVHRKDNVGSLEKAITIYGNPENCTNACKRILEVMKQEATTNNKGEITLKVLAHNNLIGRIIGKSGNTIKRIMQETETKITVSSINDINSFNLERIITVKGSIDNMSKAESMISAKLRQSYENDLQAMADEDDKCELIISDQELLA